MTAPAPQPAGRLGATDLVLALALVVAIAVVYAPVRGHQFLNYDDPEYVTENPVVRSGITAESVGWALVSVHHATWHPLTSLSHLVDVELFGLDAGAHLAVNVVLHALATLVLFAVLVGMTGARWPSAWVAALFALHPLHVESVAWVSERKDVLSGLFWMLTLACWLAYVRRPGPARYAAVVVVFVLGLLAKPMLVTLPFVLALLDLWPLGRWRAATAWRLVIEKLPLLALAAAVSVVTYLAQRHAGAIGSLAATPFSYRVGNALVSYVTYLRKTLWPSDLAVFYPPAATLHAGTALAAAAVLAAITVAAVRARRRHPYLLVGWLWYLGALVPVLGLVRQGDQAMADRFTYLPLVGVLVMAAWGAERLAATSTAARRVVVAGAAASAVACAVLSARQVRLWADSETLFRHALAVTHDNYVAHTNLGVALMERDAVDEALTHYRAAIAAAPGYADAHLDLGLALARLGRTEAAAAAYADAVRLDPTSAAAEYDWGLLLAERGDLAGAIAHYERALAIDPRHAKAENNLGWALAEQGRLEDAVTHYQRALALAPDLIATHNNLAVALEGLGRHDEALERYRTTVTLAPAEPRAHANYAALLADRGRGAEAIAEYREALRLRPAWPEVARALAWILATDPDPRLRDGAAAVALAERANTETGGRDPESLDVLAAAYAATGRLSDAVTTAERALAAARAAGRGDLAEGIAGRLAGYRGGGKKEKQEKDGW